MVRRLLGLLGCSLLDSDLTKLCSVREANGDDTGPRRSTGRKEAKEEVVQGKGYVLLLPSSVTVAPSIRPEMLNMRAQ